jgi:hypothetical protein
MKHTRYEIEPRPAGVGGGWRLRLIGQNLEIGAEVELGGGVFPVKPGENEKDAYADAGKPARNGWMKILQNRNNSQLQPADARTIFDVWV